MSQEIGYVMLSHGMSLVIMLTKDWSSSLTRACILFQIPLIFTFMLPVQKLPIYQGQHKQLMVLSMTPS
jgi:hypothetical protein